MFTMSLRFSATLENPGSLAIMLSAIFLQLFAELNCLVLKIRGEIPYNVIIQCQSFITQ